METIASYISAEDLEKYKAEINKITSPLGLQGYFISLNKELKENVDIQQAIKNRRKEI